MILTARRPGSARLASLAALTLAAATVLAACGSPATPAASGAASQGTQPASAAATAGAPAPAALPAEVDTATAAKLVKDGAFLLDVREPDEWAAGHVKGATLIPLGDLPNRLADVPRDRQVVVMCRTGHRSAQGRDILLAAGFPSVTSMAGGITAWVADGRPTVTGS